MRVFNCALIKISIHEYSFINTFNILNFCRHKSNIFSSAQFRNGNDIERNIINTRKSISI